MLMEASLSFSLYKTARISFRVWQSNRRVFDDLAASICSLTKTDVRWLICLTGVQTFRDIQTLKPVHIAEIVRTWCSKRPHNYCSDKLLPRASVLISFTTAIFSFYPLSLLLSIGTSLSSVFRESFLFPVSVRSLARIISSLMPLSLLCVFHLSFCGWSTFYLFNVSSKWHYVPSDELSRIRELYSQSHRRGPRAIFLYFVFHE